jgi:uncharacterized protein YraI
MWRKVLLALAVLMAWSTIGVQSAAAQTASSWTVCFFNNPSLADPCVLRRVDPSITFNWGGGSPAPGVNADNFSARWTTVVNFPAGNYRFYAQADDGVGIRLNDTTTIISTMDHPRPGQLLTADVSLNGATKIQVDYQEIGGDASIYISWANLATNPTGPNFFQQPPSSSNSILTGIWTAQYYGNPTLSGAPTLIQTEGTPTHNWGNASPVVSIPADNWSARWTSLQTLPAGTYQLTVRADDGVRVGIDGVIYVNEFHGATGQTYSVAVPLGAGQHSFLVEYYEAGGIAFLDFNFTPATPVQPQPNPTGALATVTAFKLNVRDAPNAFTGNILTKINQNETYSIVGRNSAATTWWQINVNGMLGWVNGNFVTVTNTALVPITSTVGTGSSGSAPPVTVGCPGAPTQRLAVNRIGRAVSGFNVNLRSAPGLTSPKIGTIFSGTLFTILGGPQCQSSMSWWQVNYNGVVGWAAEGTGSNYWLELAS